MNSFRIKRVYPKIHPTDLKKRVGKAVLWGLVPIEPILEILILPASIFLKKFLRKDNSEDWIEVKTGKIFITNAESSTTEEFELKDLKSLKIYFCLNLAIETDEELDEEQFKKSISRITFSSEGMSYEYFYDCKKRELLKICDYLYKNEIIFKEFDNGKRVFMGKQPKYNEIQKLKKQYNIEW